MPPLLGAGWVFGAFSLVLLLSGYAYTGYAIVYLTSKLPIIGGLVSGALNWVWTEAIQLVSQVTATAMRPAIYEFQAFNQSIHGTLADIWAGCNHLMQMCQMIGLQMIPATLSAAKNYAWNLTRGEAHERAIQIGNLMRMIARLQVEIRNIHYVTPDQAKRLADAEIHRLVDGKIASLSHRVWAIQFQLAGLAATLSALQAAEAALQATIDTCMVSSCAGAANNIANVLKRLWPTIAKDLLGTAEVGAIVAMLYEMYEHPQQAASATATGARSMINTAEALVDSLLNVSIPQV